MSERLPTGWAQTTLGNVVAVVRGVSYEKSEARDAPAPGLIPLLRATNIQEQLRFDEVVYVPESRVSNEQRLRPGDIVIAASSGSRSVVGKAAPLLEKWMGAFGAFCMVVRPVKEIEPKYISYFMSTGEYRDRVSTLAAGVNINNLKRQHITDTPLRLAPLPEQRRIVEELEQQLTRLDAGLEAVKRVQTHLKRYRASILKAACEGRLVPTEAELARREKRDHESANKLLERILKQRRANWEADQLAKMKASGRLPKDEGWRAKYVEPNGIDGSNHLPSLPEGWAWASAEQIAAIQGGIQKQPSRTPRRNVYPFLRVANVLRNRLDLTEIHSIELFGGELERLRLEPGDLLIVEGNGSATEIGRMAVWTGAITNCIHQNHLIRLRPLTGVLSAFFSIYWNSPDGASRVFAKANSTSGLYTLSVSKIAGLPVPLPPLEEQRRISEEVETRLSLIDTIESQLHRDLERTGHLRQSVLRRAFSGMLVPQDPHDEPATKLLETIVRATPAPLPKRHAQRRGKQRTESTP